MSPTQRDGCTPRFYASMSLRLTNIERYLTLTTSGIYTYILLYSLLKLTSLREELGVYKLEGLLFNHSGGAFCLESPVQSLQLWLGETRGAAQGGYRVRSVPGQLLTQLLEFRIWKCNGND